MNTQTNTPSRPTKAGWRPAEWASDAGVSRGYVYLAIAAGTIASIRIGNMRIITTSPAEFLARQGGE